MVAVVVYEMRVGVVKGNQLVSTKDGTVVGTGISMTYGAISSDMEMQELSAISNIMFELGTGTNTTSFSLTTNGVSRTACVTNCVSDYITTFFTSDGLVIYSGTDVFISNPSVSLLNAMTLHGVVVDNKYTFAANTESTAMSPVTIQSAGNWRYAANRPTAPPLPPPKRK